MDDLVLLALDGSASRTLVKGPFRNRAAAWSPDGRAIAFPSDREGKYEIWSIGADGGDLRRVLRAASPLLGPAWSPDGSRLIALEVSEAPGIVVHRLSDPPDQYERLPKLPDGDSPGWGTWSRAGEAIFTVGNQGSLWKWSFAERSYRRLPWSNTATLADVEGELPDGRLVVVAETLAAQGGAGIAVSAEAGRPRIRLEVLVLDPKSGETRVLWATPGAYRPGLGLDPVQRSLWIIRWQEEADLWIARSAEAPR
ncbi:MAG TPA: hypothetical protein VHI98_11385 [Vicinamibacterales bacterium]|nr:hypothetical protein [Vicinamibacterales bacterium]